jgi:hypothetical protein
MFIRQAPGNPDPATGTLVPVPSNPATRKGIPRPIHAAECCLDPWFCCDNGSSDARSCPVHQSSLAM